MLPFAASYRFVSSNIQAEDIQDQAGHRGGLTRSESQELLLVEAENDLGEFCDLIGEDEQAPEEREDELAVTINIYIIYTNQQSSS